MGSLVTLSQSKERTTRNLLLLKLTPCMQVRIRNTTDGRQEVFEVDPDEPYKDTLIISSQPGQLDDYATGLNDVKFWVKGLVRLAGCGH